MSFRRMLPFLLINIVVSATVMLAILFWWDSRDMSETAVSIIPTATVPLATAVSQDNPSPAETSAEETAPEEEDDVPTHTVAAGDTLGIISGIYDVSMEDIMTANDMTDPNILSIGQVLIIPIGGLPDPAAVPTTVATTTPLTPTSDAPPTPIPAVEEDADGTAVIEISATSGDIETEAVQIQNLGGQQVALNGWQLVDADGHAYTFAQITLFGDGAAIQLHTGSGEDAPADLYWGLTEPIFTAGELLSLINGAGEVVATTIAP